MKKIKPAMKCQGEKHNICDWIISHFPENYEEMTYLEPFCGSANVFLNKKKSKLEILNDTDKNIIQVYYALRDEPKEFYKRLSHYKCCDSTFSKLLKKTEFEDYLDEAVNEFMLNNMSRNGLKKLFGGKTQKTWKGTIKNIFDVSERLSDSFIFNKPSLEIIQNFNQQDVLLYCNPPYLIETRDSQNVYNSDMLPEAHIKLSHILNNFKGKVLLSGCVSPLYKRLYKNWNLNKKRGEKNQKTESLWRNF